MYYWRVQEIKDTIINWFLSEWKRKTILNDWWYMIYNVFEWSFNIDHEKILKIKTNLNRSRRKFFFYFLFEVEYLQYKSRSLNTYEQ